MDRTVCLCGKIHGGNRPGFAFGFLWTGVSGFQGISEFRKMLTDCGDIRFYGIEISVDTICDSFCHGLMVGGIGDIEVIILVAHKSHFQDRNRNGAPVGAGHVVCGDHPFVGKTGCIAVAVYDAGCKSVAFFDDVCIQILVRTGRSHGKCSGSRRTVVTVGMDADGDVRIGLCGKFGAFDVADRFVIVFTGHDDLISAGGQLFFEYLGDFEIDFILRYFGEISCCTGRSLVLGLGRTGCHRFLCTHVNPAALMSRIDADDELFSIGRRCGRRVGSRPVDAGGSVVRSIGIFVFGIGIICGSIFGSRRRRFDHCLSLLAFISSFLGGPHGGRCQQQASHKKK